MDQALALCEVSVIGKLVDPVVHWATVGEAAGLDSCVGVDDDDPDITVASETVVHDYGRAYIGRLEAETLV